VSLDVEVDPLRLKAALRDFVALSAIPAMSVGRDPEAVAAGLADSLVEVLQLEFAFVRMNNPGGVTAIEVTRGSARGNLRESLESYVGPISSGTSHEVVLDVGDGSKPYHGIAVPIGVNGQGGLVVAASTRRDFPSAIDRVLLSLTANHAAIAFENARLIHERDRAHDGLRKARDELEARVAERTVELNVANEELSALRRVATLVAEAAAPRAILDAVAGEMQALLDADQVALNRFEPDAQIVVLAHRGLDVDRTPVGSRVSHEGDNVTSIVRRTGRPARMENYDQAGGALAELARASGLRSSVSAPITVAGQVWGVVTASWKGDASPPADTEDRMAKFTHLIGTAIANTEARAEVERLAEEQAALRRVATLVAGRVAPEDLFAAVAEEVGLLMSIDATRILRYESDDTATVLARWSERAEVPPELEIGAHVALEGDTLTSRVYRSGRPARIDNDQVTGPLAAVVRGLDVPSGAGAPIVVEGRLWGVMVIGSLEGRPLPPGAEERLAQFTELVATAISNTESRSALAMLVDEQAALRRVATLVAKGVAPAEIFAAVSHEVERVFGLDTETSDAATVVRFDPGPECVMVGVAKGIERLPVGSRWKPKNLYVSTRVLETSQSSRIDESELESIGGTEADTLRQQGFLSQVASPIIAEGRLWGAITLNTREALPPDTEERLEKFTELVATAIGNTESRTALGVLVDEQAALRRVATLVARDAPSTEVFEAVATEVGKLLDTDVTVVGRYDGDGAATAIGSWSASGGGVPVGTRSAIGGHNVLTIVAETGKPARVEGYEDASGEAAEIARRYGWRSSIAAPISVEDRLWGVMLVATQRPEPFPAGAEDRLAAFTDLVATAVANTEARQALERVAAEQAALRRVATLVAEGATAEELYAGVATEVAQVLGVSATILDRYESDGSAVRLAASHDRAWTAVESILELGMRWPPEPGSLIARVYETGDAARVDDYSGLGGVIGESVRKAGVGSGCATPIVVDGSLWGAIRVFSREGESLPADAETRLAAFTELVATAIANAESSAELAASRRRIVAASDDARRRIERDLHDGVQQQLVSLGLELGGMKADPPIGDALEEQLASVTDDVVSILDSLVEVARGIHPAILAQGGLEAALSLLARRSTVPVELDARIDGQLPDAVEVAAYYVASEALTNVAKHARASVVHIAVTTDEGTLTLAVRDDGVGGADLGGGSGLVGLRDRVEALGGTIAIDSPTGSGTRVVVTLPIAARPDQEIENLLRPSQERALPTSPA
jgi:signal transduction histidine kinase